MSPNLPSEPNDSGGNSASSSSKTSLLWAYQLRKEHVHLVHRLDDINSDIVTYSTKVTDHQQTVSNLETLVKSLQTENYILKNEVTTVRDKFTASIDQINKQINTLSSFWQESLKKEEKEGVVKKLQFDVGDMAVKMKELTEGMAEVRVGMVNVEKKCECLAMKQVELASLSQGNHMVVSKEKEADNSAPNANTRVVWTQSEVRPKLVVILRYGRTREDKDESIADEAAISTMTESCVPESMPMCHHHHHHPISQVEVIYQQIKQEGRNLHDYFTFAAELRSQLPRRKQEGHMVEAFFDGLAANDEGLKTSMEKYLDELGWIWSNVESFCRPQGRHDLRRRNNKQMEFEYNTRSKARASARKRKETE